MIGSDRSGIMSTRRAKIQLTLAALLFLAASGLNAQPQPNSVSVSASPGLVTLTLPPNGVSTASSPINIVTTWRIQQGGIVVSVCGYFSNSASALSNGLGDNIPSSRVSGSVNGGPFAPFTGGGPFSPGGSLTVFTQQVRGSKNVTRTDSLSLRIDTSNLGLRAGSYSGVMRIQAFAM